MIFIFQIDRSGLIGIGKFEKKNLLLDMIYRNKNGKLEIVDGIIILTPYKIPWNNSENGSQVSYRYDIFVIYIQW